MSVQYGHERARVFERISFTFLFKQLELLFIDLFYTCVHINWATIWIQVGCVKSYGQLIELSLGLVQEYFTRTWPLMSDFKHFSTFLIRNKTISIALFCTFQTLIWSSVNATIGLYISIRKQFVTLVFWFLQRLARNISQNSLSCTDFECQMGVTFNLIKMG